jgi:hypothetical protein
MTIIPTRYGDRVTTDAMADTEAASSIPPWPIDFGPPPSAVEPDLIDGAGAVVVPVLVLAVVIFVALVAALV